MKKMLLFLGSPRKEGNTEKMALAFAEGARESGADVEFVRLAEKVIKPCIDCRKCWEKGRHCILEDDMEALYAAIDNSDVLVFAAPLYWYTWSAQMKTLWDRLLPYASDKASRNLKGKGCVLLAAAGDVASDVFEGMDFALDKSAALLGMKILGKVHALGVYGPDDIEGTDLLEEAKRLGRKCTG